MDVITVVGIGVVGCVLAILLKQYKPEYGVIISLGCGVLLLGLIAFGAAPVVNTVQELLAKVNLPLSYGETLVKSLGICFVTQLATDTCKDAGESAIASKVELGGKLAVLLVTLPLFEQILRLAMEMMSL